MNQRREHCDLTDDTRRKVVLVQRCWIMLCDVANSVVTKRFGPARERFRLVKSTGWKEDFSGFDQ